jgi:hypothetical protein
MSAQRHVRDVRTPELVNTTVDADIPPLDDGRSGHPVGIDS